jgi:hypothetical protein
MVAGMDGLHAGLGVPRMPLIPHHENAGASCESMSERANPTMIFHSFRNGRSVRLHGSGTCPVRPYFSEFPAAKFSKLAVQMWRRSIIEGVSVRVRYPTITRSFSVPALPPLHPRHAIPPPARRKPFDLASVRGFFRPRFSDLTPICIW